MKTLVNTVVFKLGKGVVLLGVFTFLISQCTQVESPFGVQESDVTSFEDLNINVKYAESYDQTEMTFSRLWPEGITAGLSKANSDNGELLVDFEKTNHILAFDENGYMSTVTEFIEGDGEMNMPESIYHSLKDNMPAESADYDPIIKRELKDGMLRYYSKSGEIVFEQLLNKDDYWINPEELDVFSNPPDSSNVNESIQGNLERMEFLGLDYQRFGEYHIGYEEEASQEDIEMGIAKYQYMLDLRNGNINIYASVKPDGNYYSVTRSNFTNINGSNVLRSEEHLQFGEINNEWGVVTRRKMTRENIKIFKK